MPRGRPPLETELIYVDHLREYSPERLTPRALRHGQVWCHLATDGDLAELHQFAARLGLPTRAFQARARRPHYDLTPELRRLAVALGAIETTTRGIVRLRRLRSNG